MHRFLEFAKSHGVLIDKLNASGNIARCGTVKNPNSKNGAYVFSGNGGWVQAWDGDGNVHVYKRDRQISQSEKSTLKKEQTKRIQEQERKHTEAREKAKEIINSAKYERHAYLAQKGFPDEVGLVIDEILYIPMRDLITYDLVGYQSIKWTGEGFEKKMLYGMRAKGAGLVLGDRKARKTILCEGYATGLSIHKAIKNGRLNASVTVCFSANNLEYIASKLRGVYIFADNDKSGVGEGVAKSTGYPYVLSDIEGEDANDLMVRAGIFAVQKKVLELLSK